MASLSLPAFALALFAGDGPVETPAAPKAPDAKEISAAIERGSALLVEMQESLDLNVKEKREWPYEGVYRVGGEIPIGYRIGGTSIGAIALIEAANGKPRPDAKAAIGRALEFVLGALDAPLMTAGFEGGYDVRGWGHAYALAFLLKLREKALVPEGAKSKIDARVRWLIDALQKTEIKSRGGWNYVRGEKIDDCAPSTFMTAPTLQILFEAAHQGEKVDAAVVARGLDTLEAARLDTGAFQYATDPKHQTGTGIEDVPGSIGRSPACETTLFLAGRGSIDHIRASLDQFFTNWEWLEKRRRQTGTHIGPYKIAPYFFFYAHRFAAQAIEFLPEVQRAEYRAKLDVLLWKVREEDGGWNDRVFPRSENYGTAMTILALREPESPRPAGWKTPTKAAK